MLAQKKRKWYLEAPHMSYKKFIKQFLSWISKIYCINATTVNTANPFASQKYLFLATLKVAKGGRTLQPCRNNWDVCICLPAVTQTQSVSRFLCFTPNVSMILFFHLPMERKQFSTQGLKEPHTIIFIPPCFSTIQLSLDRVFMGLHGPWRECLK